MKVKKNDINKNLILFLLAHLITWTLIPTISNINLPLDTIEALAWGTNLDWGYNKHPPLSAWIVEFFYRLFGSQDWAYYLLSQLFVISSFFIIFKFSEFFLSNRILSLISVLLLEGIFFYNYTTPEFNVNVCQLPFWALTVYYLWEGINKNNNLSWVLFGLFAACGFLSKYLFIYLLVAIDVFFIYLILNKKFNIKCLISLISFFVVIFSHFFWLFENDFITITYALSRAQLENISFIEAHLFQPIIFISKQIGTLIPFFIMLFFIISKFKFKINYKDKKLVFLLIINFLPILLMFLTSLFFGIKIRTMWMTPFYLFFGVLFMYIFQKYISLKKLEKFFIVFLFLFILSPSLYLYVSITQSNKRTDYPGKEIAKIVQQKWENNFSNNISLVGGDEWHAGNLSYHLKSRPVWDNIFEKKNETLLKENNSGFVLIGEKDILSNICNGVFLQIKEMGACMIGEKK